MAVDDGLRPVFRSHLTDFDWCTIETGMTTQGVPDSNYCARPSAPGLPGVEGWIEYKATDGWAVTLRPEQIGWISRRVRWGGRVHIAVRRRHDGGPRLGPACDELWLFAGALAREARVGGLRHPSIKQTAMVHQGGPSKWDWRAVAAALVR